MQRQAVLDDVRERSEHIRRALASDELPEQVLKMSYQLKEFIIGMKRGKHPELERELDYARATIDRLEKAGYRLPITSADDLYVHAHAVWKAKLGWVAGVVAIIALLGWAGQAMMRAGNEAATPARIEGRVMIRDDDGVQTPVAYEVVGLVQNHPPDSNAEKFHDDLIKALTDNYNKALSKHHDHKLAKARCKTLAFKELRKRRAMLPTLEESNTNPVGSFSFTTVPVPKITGEETHPVYYVVAVTEKDGEAAGAWMVPIHQKDDKNHYILRPGKTTNVELRNDNSLLEEAMRALRSGPAGSAR